MANYSTWTVAKLEKEKDKIEKAIAARDGKMRQGALAQVKAAARQAGFDISELLSDLKATSKVSGAKKRTASPGKKGRKTGKVAPKYKNPEDGVTWSGRGRKPKWIEAHLAKHGNLDKVAL